MQTVSRYLSERSFSSTHRVLQHNRETFHQAKVICLVEGTNSLTDQVRNAYLLHMLSQEGDVLLIPDQTHFVERSWDNKMRWMRQDLDVKTWDSVEHRRLFVEEVLPELERVQAVVESLLVASEQEGWQERIEACFPYLPEDIFNKARRFPFSSVPVEERSSVAISLLSHCIRNCMENSVKKAKEAMFVLRNDSLAQSILSNSAYSSKRIFVLADQVHFIAKENSFADHRKGIELLEEALHPLSYVVLEPKLGVWEQDRNLLVVMGLLDAKQEQKSWFEGVMSSGLQALSFVTNKVWNYLMIPKHRSLDGIREEVKEEVIEEYVELPRLEDPFEKLLQLFEEISVTSAARPSIYLPWEEHGS